ncbi:hypothetical protein BDW02DRAFT_494864 [Decorospora gaudefroyi]|uniref:Uncharacterized protein n=1 Tax=Decorospora gaudefroyi TaxID=184978 RepID=A0A6A5KNE5_9PLEO|nr:hypothetical protein BDW02DRAFT_494864 [Decorospora gaudefroyi]
MPLEMIIEICNQHGDKTEIINMRRTNAAFFRAGEIAYGKAVACNRTVFPTSASISAFHALLDYWPWLSRHVRDVTLVGEGLRAHPFGSDWGWENVEHEEGVRFTDADYEIIHYANQEHTNEVALQGAFHVSGGYRAMLVGLFKRLPKLETINVRKLKVGEHIPGWNGPAALRDLSFYHPKLNTNDVYYGEWQYDDLHKRVTEYTDEYGELITEDGAGPQVFFIDDVILAMEAAGIPANINGSLH